MRPLASRVTTAQPLHAALAGLGLGLGLIVAIGAQNAFVLRQGIRREYVLAGCAHLHRLRRSPDHRGGRRRGRPLHGGAVAGHRRPLGRGPVPAQLRRPGRSARTAPSRLRRRGTVASTRAPADERTAGWRGSDGPRPGATTTSTASSGSDRVGTATLAMEAPAHDRSGVARAESAARSRRDGSRADLAQPPRVPRHLRPARLRRLLSRAGALGVRGRRHPGKHALVLRSRPGSARSGSRLRPPRRLAGARWRSSPW